MGGNALTDTYHRKSWEFLRKTRSSKLGMRVRGAPPGWRLTITIWAAVVLIILAVNIGVLIWATARTPLAYPVTENNSVRESNPILYLGDCETVTRTKTWTHLVINIASSLLLLASANCMQCLSSPTRDEIDKAHAAGHFLDIGILSSRNFRHIARWRAALWMLLAVSSLPLHLFYNSIIFTSLGARSVATFLASRDFVNDHSLNATQTVWLPIDALDISRPDAGNFTRSTLTAMMPNGPQHSGQSLSAEDCLRTFSASVVSTFRSVTLVLDFADPSQIVWGDMIEGDGLQQPWSCYDANQPGGTNVAGVLSSCGLCDKFRLIEDVWHEACGTRGDPDLNWPSHPAIISCETEPASGYCGVELVTPLMIVVIIANILKAVAMVSTVLLLKFQPLVTTGDAVRSFLDRPDSHTRGGPPLYLEQISRGPPKFRDSVCYTKRSRCQGRNQMTWEEASRPRWFKSVSKTRWLMTISLCLLIELVAGIILYGMKSTLDESRQAGFGAVDSRFFHAFDKSSAILSAVTNFPQLAVSLAYVGYYSLFSAMLGASEMSRYAVRKTSLRVSSPQRGTQRGTHWLTIPFPYAFTLLAGMAVLHWFMSQALFIVRLNRVDSDLSTGAGYDQISWNVMNGFGYSPIAVVAAISLGGALILCPLLLGFRPLPGGMPIIGHNSLAIANACHPDVTDEVDLAEKPLMYGVLPTLGNTSKRRVGFSSLEVEGLQCGEIYECQQCPQSLSIPDNFGWDCCTAEAVDQKRENSFLNIVDENESDLDNLHNRDVSLDLEPHGETEPEATPEVCPSESQTLLAQAHVEEPDGLRLIPRKPVPLPK